MDSNYSIRLINSVKNKDLTEALDIYIYIYTVDEGSETST